MRRWEILGWMKDKRAYHAGGTFLTTRPLSEFSICACSWSDSPLFCFTQLNPRCPAKVPICRNVDRVEDGYFALPNSILGYGQSLYCQLCTTNQPAFMVVVYTPVANLSMDVFVFLPPTLPHTPIISICAPAVTHQSIIITHHSNIITHPSIITTYTNTISTQPSNIITHPSNIATHPNIITTHP